VALHNIQSRVVPENMTLRELVIPFGDSGYIALYEYRPNMGIIIMLAIKHQKENDYS